jgi:hypothetical protein
MIDFVSFFEYMSPNEPVLGQLTRFEGPLETLSPDRRSDPIFQKMYKFNWDKQERGKSMTDEQYLLLPPRVLGYALKQKMWAQFLVDGLREPEEGDASTFQDKLQLDDEHKDLIRKSVLAHSEGKIAASGGGFKALEDFAPDKGKGLIIMLYGKLEEAMRLIRG